MQSAFRTTVSSLFIAAVLVGAGSASASALEYEVKTAPILAKGEHHVVKIGELIVTCKKAELKYSGVVGNFAVVAFTPVWSECRALESTVTLKSEKASLELLTPTLVPFTTEITMPVSLTGMSGAKIVMAGTFEGEHCEVTIPLQSFVHEKTRFLNNGGGTGGELRLELERISFFSNHKCGGLVPNEGKSAVYEGYAPETGLIVVP